eukprot:1939455-Prymnesium_polylepis.1
MCIRDSVCTHLRRQRAAHQRDLGDRPVVSEEPHRPPDGARVAQHQDETRLAQRGGRQARYGGEVDHAG